MNYLPVSLDIRDKMCLIVGGGGIALRKAKRLLSAGGNVVIVAPQVDQEISKLAGEKKITHIKCQYNKEQMKDITLVIAATDNVALNKQISLDAKKHNLLVNVVDQPKLCNFISPSIIDRSPLTIAISTGGSGPVFARALREKLEWLIPPDVALMLDTANSVREKVTNTIPNFMERKSYWESYFSQRVDWLSEYNYGAAPLLQIVAVNDSASIDNLAKSKDKYSTNFSLDSPSQYGKIFLIDLGSGEIDNLSIKTIRALQKADVVIHHNETPQAITEIIRRDADQIFNNNEENTSVTFDKTFWKNLVADHDLLSNICLVRLGHNFEAHERELVKSYCESVQLKPEKDRLQIYRTISQ